MPSDWGRVRLSDLITIKHGFAFPGEHFSGTPTESVLLTPGNFKIGGGFNGDKLKYFRGEVPKNYILQPNDLIVTMTDLSKNMDTLGFPAWVPDFADRVALHNQRLGLVELISSEAEVAFIYYLMCSTGYRREVLASSTGTTVHHTSPSRILDYEFLLPPLPEQRSIAATLGALDDKIESNRRMKGIVENLLPSKVSAALGEEQETIPVSGLAEFVNGGAYTKGASGTGRMVVRIAELNSGPGASTVYNDIEVPEDKTVCPGDILMAWSGSLGVYRWVLGEAIVNQHIFKVKPDGKFPPWLVFDRLRSVMPVFQSIAKDKATTMGHIQRGHLTSTTIEVPSADLIESLDRELSPLWERLLVVEQENIRLAELRNALLPELVSGRIRVPEAEQAVAEVTA
jgi:type I restriction enzyme S subunit